MKRNLLAIVAILTSMAALSILVYLLGAARSDNPDLALAAPLDLTVTQVDPSDALNDLDTPIVITGTDFVDGATVLLGDVSLEDVSWASTTTLKATVPWGMNPGVYTATVANPGGESSTLANAFTVTQGIGVWKTGGPYGGDVLDLVLHPVTPTTVYALVHDTGLFATYDGADHWQLLHLEDWPTRLAFDAQDPQTMYLGCRDVMRSQDGGQTWEKVFLHEVERVSYPAAHPISPGVVYVGEALFPGDPVPPGEEGGLYWSDDYGETWYTRTNGLTDTHVVAIAFHPDDPNRMVVGTREGNIFLSTDGGDLWHWVACPAWHIERLYFNPSGAHEAWATTAVPHDPPYPPYLLRSDDPNLETWVPVTITEDTGPAGAIWSLTFVSETQTIWVGAGANGGYTSTNSGLTWSPVSGYSGSFGEVRHFAVDPSNLNRVYMGCTTMGINRSDDGGVTWEVAHDGLAGIVPKALAVSPHDLQTVYVKTYALGVLKSEDGGQTWRELGLGHGGSPRRGLLAVDPFIPRRVYFGDTADAGVMRLQISEDGGGAWHEVTATLPVTWSNWECDVNEVAPHSTISGQILAGARLYEHVTPGPIGEGAIYLSKDQGEHWRYITPTQPISKVVEFAYDATDPNLVYAATDGTGLWKSTDSGWSWQRISSWPGGPDVYSLVAHPDTPNTVYAITEITWPFEGKALFVSQDAGQTWTLLDEEPHRGSDVLLFAPTQPATLYRGGSGLHRSVDGGHDWEEVEGLPDGDVWSMDAAGDDERVVVYVGTSGGFVWSEEPVVRLSEEIIDQNSQLLGGGVYRYTTQRTWKVYLSLVLKAYTP